MPLQKRVAAEFLGTLWLVLGGCGSAVIAAKFPEVGIGFVGVALAFGLTLLTMCYAIGRISGCHLNPAVTLGLFAGGRCAAADVVPYIVAQVAGAVVAAWLLLTIASGNGSDVLAGGLAANGYGGHSPGGYTPGAAFLCEVVMTFFFVLIIMGATDKLSAPGFAGLAIGLALTLIHLVRIPVSNTSVNPARSTGPELMVGDWAIGQLWMFWVAPILGGVLGGVAYRWMGKGG